MKATETFVESLTDKASAELLDLILKRRGQSGGDQGVDDVFETGEAKIRLEDYERLDTNRDGFISRSRPAAFCCDAQWRAFRGWMAGAC